MCKSCLTADFGQTFAWKALPLLGQRAPEVRLADQRGPGRERAKNVVFGMAGGADDVNIRMPSAHLFSQLRSVHAARQTEIGEPHVDATELLEALECLRRVLGGCHSKP